MPHRLRRLRQQFEELSSKLEGCRESIHRRELLKRMKIVIDETDKLISAEFLHLDSMRDSGSAKLWESRKPETSAREETLEELCRQADAEQDLERLLELASKIQPLIEARRSRKKPVVLYDQARRQV
jgi:hypothetical protein